MIPLCILFLNHTDDEITRWHYKSFKYLNPDAAVVPLTFDQGIEGSIKLKPEFWVLSSKWAACDTLLWAYADHPEKVEAQRYLVIEWDTLCTMPVKEFYKDVWDVHVSGAFVDHGPDWGWWSTPGDPMAEWYKAHRHYWKGCDGGITPLCGTMMSHHAYRQMSFASKIWFFELMFSEARIGTLAKFCGCEPRQIRPDAQKFIDASEERQITELGIWHPVKSQ